MANTFEEWDANHRKQLLKNLESGVPNTESGFELCWLAAQAAQRERDAGRLRQRARVIRIGKVVSCSSEIANLIDSYANAILADTGDEPCSPTKN